MHKPQRKNVQDSFVILVSGSGSRGDYYEAPPPNYKPSSSTNNLNFSTMKLFNRFRKIMMRLIFSIPSSSSSSHRGGTSSSAMASSSSSWSSSSSNCKQRNSNCERFDPPKTSCSSYYSSQVHYSEAIADCIEFFNKSSHSHDGNDTFDGPNSDISHLV